jgi:hypothetical protein
VKFTLVMGLVLGLTGSNAFGSVDFLGFEYPAQPVSIEKITESVLSFFEGQSDQPNTKPSYRSRSQGCEKHQFCPESHALLSVQIIYLMLAGLVLIRGSLLCYQVADYGYDIVQGGRNRIGWSVALGSFLLIPLAMTLGLAFGYWVAFEGGLRE